MQTLASATQAYNSAMDRGDAKGVERAMVRINRLARPRMSINALDAMVHNAQVDRANTYEHSERGFNTAMRVNSNRPSRLPSTRSNYKFPNGMTVTWERVHASPLSYKQRMADAQPLRERKRTPEVVFTYGVSTFEAQAQGKRKMVRERESPLPAGISLATLIFGRAHA